MKRDLIPTRVLQKTNGQNLSSPTPLRLKKLKKVPSQISARLLQTTIVTTTKTGA